MDRRRLVVVVLLVILFSNMQGIYSTRDSTSHLDIVSISQSELLDPTIKIHLPGSSFDDEEKLSWSPNNLSQFRQIQFSNVRQHGYIKFDYDDKYYRSLNF